MPRVARVDMANYPYHMLLTARSCDCGYSTNNNAKTTVYIYDSLYRLTSASTTDAATGQTDYLRTYAYDKLGNITYKSDQGYYGYYGDTGSLYSNPHAVSDIASTTLSYDNNGNLTHNGTDAYLWSYNNYLTEAGGTASSTYGYDYTGQRISTKVGNNASTTIANRYYSTTGATTTLHIFAGDTLIATVEGTPTATSTYYAHTDHLSGTNVISDAVGEMVQLLDYYPFGEPRLNTTTGAHDEKRKFIGEEYDEDTGENGDKYIKTLKSVV
jgi:hypothetical protein